MVQSPELVASYWTLAGPVLPLAGDVSSTLSLADRARAANAAGWRGLGLHVDDVAKGLQKHSYGELRQILDDNGIVHVELEALFDWFAKGERRKTSDAVRANLLRAAEALGAYQIKIAGDFSGAAWTTDRLIAEFQELARQAGDAGTAVSIELIHESGICDLETGIAVVEGAGAANGGLLLDIWHVARAGIDYGAVAAIPAHLIKHIELCDAAAVQVGTMIEDTILRRALPGEGDLDVPAFLRAIAATGYRGLVGVEILSDAQRARSLDDAANVTFRKTMDVLAEAGWA